MFLNATLSLLEGVYPEEFLTVVLPLAISMIIFFIGNLPEALRDFDHLTQHSTLSLPALIGQLCVRQRQHPRGNLGRDL